MSTSTLRPITSPTLAQERLYSHRPETLPRRHSTISVSRRDPRPFRSSPLAGPALVVPTLSLTPSDLELPRALSDSYLASLPPALAKPGRRTSVVSRDSPGIYIPQRPRTSPSATAASIPTSTPTSAPTPTSTPTLPSRVASPFTRRLSFLARGRLNGTDGYKAEAPASVRPDKITAPPPATRQRMPSTSRNPSENWLSSTAFDTTPHFSRLSLGTGVVLPVPAHQYRRARSCSTLNASGNVSGRRASFVQKTVPEDAEVEAEAQAEVAVEMKPKEEAKNEIEIEAEEPPVPSLTRSSSNSGVSFAGIPTPMSVSFLKIPVPEEKEVDKRRAVVEVVEAESEREHRKCGLGLGLRGAKLETKLGLRSKSSTKSSFLGFSFSSEVIEAPTSTISASNSKTKNARRPSGSMRKLWKSLRRTSVGN